MRWAVALLSLADLVALASVWLMWIALRQTQDAKIQAQREAAQLRKERLRLKEDLEENDRVLSRLQNELRIKQRILDGIADAQRRKAEGREDEMRGCGIHSAAEVFK